jgi:hypothetical protein
MTRLSIVLVVVCLAGGCGSPDPSAGTSPGPSPPVTERERGARPPLSERDKIEALIRHVEAMEGAVFVRNGTDHDARTAGRFLRGKWDDRATEVKTARDFIDKIASVSSKTREPYLIRLKDGTEVKSGAYLAGELERIERAEHEP